MVGCSSIVDSNYMAFFLIIHNGQWRFAWRGLNSNTTTCTKEKIISLYNIRAPQRSALVVNNLLIMPVLLL